MYTAQTYSPPQHPRRFFPSHVFPPISIYNIPRAWVYDDALAVSIARPQAAQYTLYDDDNPIQKVAVRDRGAQHER
jgi:hypothetical protein